MKRRHTFAWFFLALALAQMACFAPIAIPLTGSGATRTPGVPATPSTTATSTAPCTDKVTFVGDVNMPDNTQVTPGEVFTKTWRVKNDGSCAWGPNGALNALVFTGGYQMGAPEQVPLANEVAPGQTADVSVKLTAPTDPGTYVSQWMFRVNDGSKANDRIGVGTDGKGALYVKIVVK